MSNRQYTPGDETRLMTIQRYIAQEERLHPEATGEFSTLLRNISEEFPCGKYAMLFDPLDGSSNIEANVTAEEFIAGKR